MNAIFAAIKARYDSPAGSALRTLLTGGLWLHEAPTSAREPYGVMQRVSQRNADTFRERIFDEMLQLDIYATTNAAVLALLDAALAVFDGARIEAPGMAEAILERENVYGPMREGTNKTDPWRVTLELAALVEAA